MVPRIAKAGRSFKGAAQYYLHDKGAQSSKRVARIETLNLPTDNGARATAHMIDTAEHAEHLKRANGVTRGRKSQKPVYTYSLSWHPDEKPSLDHQVDMAKETLRVLGLEEHQAMIVVHTDQDHPHVHVIVNRVHPETGCSASNSNDQLKLSQWAEDYERRHGRILCHNRVANNDNRKRHFVKDKSLTRTEHYEVKKALSDNLWAAYRDQKNTAFKANKPKFRELWEKRSTAIANAQSEIKDTYRPAWRDLYKHQGRQLDRFDNYLSARFAYALRQKHTNRLRALSQAITYNQNLRAAFISDLAAKRSDLGKQQSEETRTAVRGISNDYQKRREMLQADISQDGKDRLDDFRTRSDQIWNDKAGSASDAQKRAREAAAKKLRSDAKKNKRDRNRTRRPRR
ncbi:MAG: relaxase/mobilization nuclease domain-containing protein [Pseudomonadota bacterium]